MRPYPVRGELRDGDGGEDADDGYDDHELDQREALLVVSALELPVDCSKHVSLLS